MEDLRRIEQKNVNWTFQSDIFGNKCKHLAAQKIQEKQQLTCKALKIPGQHIHNKIKADTFNESDRDGP